MGLLDDWTAGSHTSDAGVTYPTYRKGSGPGVVIIHEVPGIYHHVVAFAEEVVAAGYTVVLPELFGTTGARKNEWTMAKSILKLCVSAEFNCLRRGRTSPVTAWLRSLANALHEEIGGPGVGALGMCATGNFALAMMLEPSVIAPVVAQPSLPFAISRKHGADLNLSPEDLAVVKERAAAGCQVLGLQYRDDFMVGTRFQTLGDELGGAFIPYWFAGKGHSTLTTERQQVAVDKVLEFFADKLTPVG
ncbi:dienelactone hydrolase family protein [Aldersonia sp. NBC_00410]|uniref:dienelactone hydrolase family protein n=1 Tax=Aldersonia sp. NBC_00410 TaxID=2975954 RepID=UPI002257BC9E|nr:dienelactone hydrolase family protein [Aldersonia sp. NBC_00410]MCX5045277.1 dienelactone hydrolase family protein [Aldersonia sp. NBC_00410]